MAVAASIPPNALPPGPRGRFFSGNFHELRADPLGFLAQCAAEYGDLVSIRLGLHHVFLLNHPDLIEEVLVEKPKQFIKHAALRYNHRLFGTGLLTSESDFWLRQRRLIQPAFHRARLAEYALPMVAHAARLRDTWKDGEQRDLHAEMSRLTLGITAQTLFSTDAGAKADTVRHALTELLATFDARLNSMIKLPIYIPTPNNRRLHRSVNALDKIIYGFISQRRNDPTPHSDLLSKLLQARDEDDGGQMTDRQVRDETMTLFLAGHETTALGLMWTWYALAKHPEVEARLHAEIDAVLGGPEGRLPSADDLPRLPFVEQVVLESMRIYPPVYLIGREAVQDTTIGGVRVRRGMTLWMSQWVTHRDGRFFERPTEFNPDRWANDFAQKLPKFAYFPFGGGPRVCIGNTFAMLELVLVLTTLAQRFRCTIEPDRVVTPSASFTLRPKQEMRLTLVRR